MTYKTKKITIGALTVAALVGVLVFMNQSHQLMAGVAGDSTIVSAKFNKVDWLIEGSEVRLAGNRIGTIERVDLDD